MYEATKRVDGVMDLKVLLISYTIITFVKDASATNLLNIDYLFACYSCISHPLKSVQLIDANKIYDYCFFAELRGWSVHIIAKWRL